MYNVRNTNTQDLTMIGFPRITESAEAMTKIPGAESSEKRELRLTGIEGTRTLYNGNRETQE